MDSDKKRQLKKDYKATPAVGAIYALDCTASGRRVIKSTTNIAGIKNRFQFAINIDGCPDPVMRDEWTKYGSGAFALTVLEELKMKEGQTSREFADDIALLYEMWTENSRQDGQ